MVTPLVGVWIEISLNSLLPHFCNVTPLVGVWIEIISERKSPIAFPSHSPCGSVD